MVANDFDYTKDLKLDYQSGVVSFKHNRLVMFDVDTMGLLRSMLVNELGKEKARAIFLQFGYQQGFADLLQLRANYTFDTEHDLLAAGPVMHTWEGVVKAIPQELRFNRETGDFYMRGVWVNSYEADQHLAYLGPSDEVVCWSLMGYASGYATAFFGKKLIAIEPACVGKGDDTCEFEIKPEADWGDEAQPYIEALKNFKI